MNDFGTTFFYIVVMVAVLIGAYLTTKFISGKTKKLQNGRFMNLIERLPLGKDKNIVLIEVGGENFLVGVTNQNISILGQIDNENIKSVKESKKAASQKGIIERLRGYVSNAKDAQENLRKARMQYGSGQFASNKTSQSDILKQMDDAIKQRRDRYESGDDNK